ncbi:quinohemoprotein amine dehydrogenase subunit alpha [Amphritea japonica]|uniref:Quinohemoprotein amine dehydrogenase subunit alpha n=1 Tax=Amphritea japonica ATCC BAA-1530 TaxID=1278309 RepID=A0A7R6PMH2_9GAMM|nr:quinohemoprotein amine dehydrogenase subunit alpha [Amphritea japonica]BBB27020.1 quinohemoprotein amine dehydrogenase subunit alpha [Amphritea japonica ATCC BAA-1530]
MKKFKLPRLTGGLLLAGMILPTGAVQANDAETIIQSKCVACHTEEKAEPLQMSRMSHQRKTPEGWLMTIARMQVMHGLEVTDDERRTLVKYFADKQGLAPEETEGSRYAMERRLNTMESFESANFEEMCARCHSGARVKLQRRPASEWEHLVHFHLGQWPTLEYQAMARDRDWMDLAFKKMVPELATDFSLKSASWDKWQSVKSVPVSGSWSFSAQMAGKGDVRGVMSISGGKDDQYSVSIDGEYADGSAFKGSGTAIVYTGYEWRANLTVDGVAMRQVFALSADGSELNGRMFEAVHDEAGMDFSALRSGSKAKLLSVQPGYIRAGSTEVLTIVGAGLGKKISLGDGIKVVSEMYRDDNKVVVQATANAAAKPGARDVKAGKAEGALLNVYDRIDSVKVVPDFAVARVGGNGGSTPKYNAHFQAEAWMNGVDGKPGTEDDMRIGFVPAKWHVEPFDAQAEADRDTHFAGRMDEKSGLFTTGASGPNPERRMSTNNAGNLKVIAEVMEGANALSAEGQMIVTVQRWNNPPLP